MANYADTNRLALQYAMSELMNMPEFKRKKSAVLEMLLANGQTLISGKERQLLDIKKTDSDTVEVSILTKPASNAVTNRSYTHSGDIGDSEKATLSFITRGQKFKYSMKQADRDSVFSLNEMRGKLLLGHIGHVLDTLETYYLAWLNTNKSQVSNTPTLGEWDGSTYIYKVDNDDINLYFQRIKGFMRENYYSGQMQMIANEAISQKAEYLIQQGNQNSENLAWQISNISPFPSTELSTDAGYVGMAYILPFGTVGLEQWIPKMNRGGFGDPFKNGGMYYNIADPYGSGLNFAIHETATGADNQSAAGERQDVDVEVEVTIDTAPVKATMSTTNASPIFKTGLLEAGGA
jgi:hypothetical protein